MKKIKGLIIILVIIVVFIVSAVVIVGLAAGRADLDEPRLSNKSRDIVVFDENNKVLIDNHNKYIEHYELPEDLINAFVAVEDKRFFKHNGLDYVRIAGAARSNIKNRSFSEGASTITCQLIKNTHLSSDKTISRKLKEANLATKVERLYSKEEIITMYLNAIYFGNSIYGVGRAARVYFDKDVSELTLEESATLAAVVVNPAKYSPIINYESNKNRRATVLKLMREQGYIDDSQYDNAIKTDIKIIGNTVSVNNQSYKHNAINEACTILNTDAFTIRENKYKIYTYCKPKEQLILHAALNNPDLLIVNDNGIMPDAAAMLVDNQTAGVSAYYSSMYHLANDFRRQPGSLIKPISVYGAAIEKGVLLPATPILDEQTDFEGYKPRNYNDNYFGWTTARTALAHSLNASAVKVLTYATVPYSMDYSKRMGFTLHEEDENLALALGGITYGLTMSELSGAYMAYANGGVYSAPAFVRMIKDADGNIIYKHNKEQRQATSKEVSYMVTDMLKDTVKEGTAKKLSAFNFDIAAKTGTVASKGGNSDAWCATYTSEDTLVVWQGNSNYSAHSILSNKITGGSYPTIMARQVLSNIYKHKPKPFSTPDTLKLTAFDRYTMDNQHTLKLAGEYTPDEYLVYDYAPVEINLEKSEIFNNPNMDDFMVEVKEGEVLITFESLPFYSYEIIRRIGFGDTKIATVTQMDGLVTIKDMPPEEGVVLYSITPYIDTPDKTARGNSTQHKGIYYRRTRDNTITETISFGYVLNILNLITIVK